MKDYYEFTIHQRNGEVIKLEEIQEFQVLDKFIYFQGFAESYEKMNERHVKKDWFPIEDIEYMEAVFYFKQK